MIDKDALQQLLEQKDSWTREELAQALERLPRRKPRFETDSGIPYEDIIGPEAIAQMDPAEIGLPGQYPYTRGVQPTMYRGRLWTMRQFAGFGSPEDTNKRFKYLLEHGVMGLSTAFDMPTLMGYDPDHPMSLGEVGKEGVSVASLEDMEVLFADIPLDKVTTSMTINAPAIIMLAMYVAVAEKQGVGPEKLGGTIQADILKEFIAQKEWICPPRPSMRILIDMIEWCTHNMPRWNSVSVSGYHIREAGATAVQELAFTLADGLGYVEWSIERGMDVDEFAPRLSFFWDVHNDFLEEIAKFRAARRMWAKLLKERYGAKDARSLLLRTHAQTAGVSLTAQQPLNNVARVALQAMAAVLGGTQSLHTNSLDETYALPTEEAVTVALRTQQIIAHESGVDRVVDPFGGSYVMEHLTNEMERRAMEIIDKIDAMGGIVAAVESGYPQKEIAESAYQHQREVDRKERIIVGVNDFVSEGDNPIELLHIDEAVARHQKERLAKVKEKRDAAAVERALAAIKQAADEGENLFPSILDAVRVYATVGEISDVFREAFGVYRETAVF
ncbi:MAG: methylmalonyl-CoA mutase family protein [Deltaproteobacteria bacterium]|nr:methylmalonyl-CoA mutase family protein [Deltaproteobacteria bacterium]